MAKYVVMGGGGFIGSNLTETILKQGDSAVVFDNFATGRRENLAQADAWAAEGGGTFETVEADIRDAKAVADAVDGADYVLLQAAIPSVQRSVQDPQTTNDVNVTGTLNVLQACKEAKVKRLVFASSSSLYGESETLPKVETMPSAPISPYGLQKLCGESYCGLFYRLYGLPTVALRYFNVFGPRQDPGSEYSAVIPKFITSIKAGKSPTIYGDGGQTRDFTYIANVVQANLNACQAGESAFGGAFNVACGERISLNDLVAEIGKLAGNPVKAHHDEPRPGDIRHSLAAIDHARKHLNYEPVVNLRDGLKLTFDAY